VLDRTFLFYVLLFNDHNGDVLSDKKMEAVGCFAMSVPIYHTTQHQIVDDRDLEEQSLLVDCVSNVMAHAQKPDFVFRRNTRVHLNRRWGVSSVYY
jgi:hypothetical protein